jgi:hypothetical protein
MSVNVMSGILWVFVIYDKQGFFIDETCWVIFERIGGAIFGFDIQVNRDNIGNVIHRAIGGDKFFSQIKEIIG